MNKKNEVHVRSKYMDHSLQFLAWVNEFGFEKSFIGQIAYKLENRFHLRRISLLFLFCLVLSLLLFLDLNVPYRATEGVTTQVDLKSPITFTIIDEVATEAKRREAELAVSALFDFDPEVYRKLDSQVYRAFNTMRSRYRAIQWAAREAKYERQVEEFFANKKIFEDEIGVAILDQDFDWLIRLRFRKYIEEVISNALSYVESHKVAGDTGASIRSDDKQIMLREVVGGKTGEEFPFDVSRILYLTKRNSIPYAEIGGFKRLSKTEQVHVVRIVSKLLSPNITYNLKETLERRKEARNSVLPVQLSIKKGQIIVPKGSVVQPIHMTILNEIRSLQDDRRTDFMALISAILFVTSILVFFSYTRRFTTNRVKVTSRDFGVMALVTLSVVFITKLFLFLMDASFMERWGEVVPERFFLFLAPVAAGPMLVGLVIASGEVVWLFTTILAILLSIMVEFDFPFLVTTIVGGIAAARGVFICRKRNDIYWAGLRAGLVNAIVIACLLILTSGNEGGLLKNLLWIVPGAFVSGLLSSMIAITFVSILESIFNYVTDVKLLELSNLSHPLMQEMVLKAPGTYHHCLSVGTMVFAAAQEIGANALLAKVMAYYHDIGKMDHPNYFIENQRKGMNPHDSISPYMSKTVLIAHVKDGAEMAIKHKLGKPILDGILQHHGTSLISYFYNKAVAEKDEHTDQVIESEFRYPGPKPQFREAALVMLADSIEAAARSFDEPTPVRLQNLVKNIIQGKFIDGQLDECNLTLKDLSVIEKSFKHTILAIYHQRMDYPHMRDGKLIAVSNDKESLRKGHPA
ncbi:MAG: HDIG domain-containing protein [Bdellovibrionales bacterium]|nr:HDIG domain-containing protein [Bdellovibrionales bacterium]